MSSAIDKLKQMKDNFVNAQMKRSLADKYDFSEIWSFTFNANKLTDILTCSGIGTDSKTKLLITRTADPVKLSENEDMQAMALGKISSYVPPEILQRIDVMIVTIDFKNGMVKGKIKYLTMENEKEVLELDTPIIPVKNLPAITTPIMLNPGS